MSVDLPAPFSPTMAWIVPASTRRLTPSLATTPGNRLTMSRSSMARGRAPSVAVTPLFLVRNWRCRAHGPAPHPRSRRSRLRDVRYLDLAGEDLLLEIVARAGVLVDGRVAGGVAHAVVLQVVVLEGTGELAVHQVGDRLVGGHVDPLERGREDVRLLL